MYVWILIAVMHIPEMPGGLASEYVAVYATADACEKERIRMQAATTTGNGLWVCQREQPQ